MTKQDWLNMIDEAGTDVIRVNNIVLAASHDPDLHNRGDEGARDYGEIMTKGSDIIFEHATIEEMIQIKEDALFAAKLQLLSMAMRAVGLNPSVIGFGFAGDEENED